MVGIIVEKIWIFKVFYVLLFDVKYSNKSDRIVDFNLKVIIGKYIG